MRRGKITAQTLLILSVLHIVLAAPVRERHLYAAAGLEKREGELESSSSPYISPRMDPVPTSSTTTATTDKFWNDELKEKVKRYFVLGTVVGAISGVIAGFQKDIFGAISPGASTIGRDLASSDAGTPSHGLLNPEIASIDLRDEDLRFWAL